MTYHSTLCQIASKVPTTFITRKDIYHSAALQKFMEMTHNA